MFSRRNMSRTLLAAMLVVAVLAVAIPTCEMIGCDMGMCSGMMRIFTHPGPSLANPCGGTWVTGSTPIGVVPTNLLTTLIVLIAVAAAAKLALSPKPAFCPVRIVDANAPPPPLEPRGERYIL